MTTHFTLTQLAQSTIDDGANAAFIETMYARYLHNPNSVSLPWQQYFNAFAATTTTERIHLTQHHRLQSPITSSPHFMTTHTATATSVFTPIAAAKQAAVLRLINTYRHRGHQIADVDPLQLRPKPPVADLELHYHQLDASDLERVFHTGSLYAADLLPLREILTLLKRAYCHTLGAEYMHITATRERRWLQKRLESYQSRPVLEPADQRWLLTLLTAAEGIEHYLHTRYVGQKRFSLEGAEALIPLLDELIQRAGRKGVNEIVVGMAHRGRLNVLINILGKPPQDIFAEFEGQHLQETYHRAGDVKYHSGFAADIATPGGPVHIALGFNPSHLEIINPVIEGAVRARQRRRGDLTGNQVLPVLIHGDAAFAGQGVVMETLQLSQTRGYATGGTVHIIINNQIGFTTSHPLDTRSTVYCTDVAKMVQAPVLHVNADDPEAVIFATRLAFDFRCEFKRDVLIDLVCYRRLGHNEADEPAVTQPLMYRAIHHHPTVRTHYADQLVTAGVITPAAAMAMVTQYRDAIAHGQVIARPVLRGVNQPQRADWKQFSHTPWHTAADTRYSHEQLVQLLTRLVSIPDQFILHPRVIKIWAERQHMVQGLQYINWGCAELLAYATLLVTGHPVRLSGQDCGRGTFFHRHAKIYCQTTGHAYTPLQHLQSDQAAFVVIDSVLSEEAVLGFEYGFASATPEGLTLWEAQFGDFANGAQVVIDQFIAAAETKWGLLCGLVLLLPHGLEGQGAEHSSARLERYLQLCAEHNLQICIPTTPAQLFHVLRRQLLRPYRRPLVLLTPKSLLRHPLAVSSLADLADGHFQLLIPEIDPLDTAHSQRVIFCAGKVYYDLLAARRARGLQHIALIRLEQLYPFPHEALRTALAPYQQVTDFIWCQEEAQNQGAWDAIHSRIQRHLIAGRQTLRYVGRPAAAAPAVGHHAIHHEQQQRLIDAALQLA